MVYNNVHDEAIGCQSGDKISNYILSEMRLQKRNSTVTRTICIMHSERI